LREKQNPKGELEREIRGGERERTRKKREREEKKLREEKQSDLRGR